MRLRPFTKLSKFARDESGISAVEFALIAPLMAMIYFGCIELSLMMTLDRKVTGATAALGDLTSRSSTITNADLTDIFEATRMVMQPGGQPKKRTVMTYHAAAFDFEIETGFFSLSNMKDLRE